MGVAVLASVVEIIASLMLGLITGLIIDFLIHRLNQRGEVLTVGLSLLLLCGETARLLHFSPLLAGMAVGFTIVNRDRRDVRLFRVINHFEPPIYVLFFTLAGAHLNLSALIIAGWVGLVYFLLRALGKLAGCRVGARIAAASATVVRYLGLAMIPQAGVAIGLIFLIRGDASLSAYTSIIIPVVLGSVVLSELTGPVCARIAVEKAGEAFVGRGVVRSAGSTLLPEKSQPVKREGSELIPWNWTRLEPAENFYGQVVFGLSRVETAPALARFATLLAHYYSAKPTAVRVLPPKDENQVDTVTPECQALFSAASKEAESLGYKADVKTIYHKEVVKGILSAADSQETWAIVLGHPLTSTPQGFRRADAIARNAPCQVIMVRLSGVLHTERILVPVVNLRNLKLLGHVIRALCGAGKHIITLLAILKSDALDEEIEKAEDVLENWVYKEHLIPHVRCRAVATEARVEAIVQEAQDHDVTVMAASQGNGLRRLFFGSLAEDVAQNCRKPMLIVYG